MRNIRAGLFLLVWLSCAWFGSWEWNPNNAVRLFAAVSLVESGEAAIDPFAPLTIDKASFGEHFYSDKAPGMTLGALPAVWLADRVTGDRAERYPAVFNDAGLGRFLRVRTRLAVASGPALLTALAALALFEIGLSLTGSAGAALFGSLAYALGTPIWGWSTTIFGHAPVSALFVLAIWGVWRGGWGGMLAAGLALGWAVVVEHQAVLGGSAIGVWALARCWREATRWWHVVPFFAGGLAALVPLIAYNLVAFGTVFRLGYQGVVGWEGMNQGLFGLTAPDPNAVRLLLAGSRRGLVWVAPVLVLAPIGLAALVRDRRTRGLAIAATVAAAVVLLVNAAYVYWDGGNSTGPRLAVPMIGPLAIGLAPFWARLRGTPAKVAAAALLAVSVAINMTIAAAEIMAPPEYRWPVWTAVIRPRFLPGDLRTVPSEWWGWTTWQGLALWAAMALPLGAWLCYAAGRRDGEKRA